MFIYDWPKLKFIGTSNYENIFYKFKFQTPSLNQVTTNVSFGKVVVVVVVVVV